MALIAFAVFAVPIRVAANAAEAPRSLDGILTTPLASGVLARVTSVQSQYALDITSTATPDGVNIIQPRAGPGRWMLQGGGGSAEFLTQSTWFINAITGNDNNNGATSGTALASWAELARRWGSDPLLQQTTDVFIETDLAEPIFVRGILRLTGINLLRIAGTVTATLHSGTITAKTDLDPASQQPSVITDAAVGDWATAGPGATSLIGHRIRLTSGANIGAVAWLAKRDAATVARTSPFGTVDPTASPPEGDPTLIDPVATDDYAVEQPTTVQGVDLNCARVNRSTTGSGFNLVAVVLSDIEVAGTPDTRVVSSGLMLILYVRSRIGTSRIDGGAIKLTLCASSATSCNEVDTLRAVASLWDAKIGTTVNCLSSRIGLNTSTLLQGIALRVGSGSTLEGTGVAVFDAPGAAISVEDATVASMSGLVWGTGNTGVGIDCKSGAKYVYNTKPIITGTAGDTEVGSLGVTAYAAIPIFDGGATGTGAAIVLDV